MGIDDMEDGRDLNSQYWCMRIDNDEAFETFRNLKVNLIMIYCRKLIYYGLYLALKLVWCGLNLALYE